jgi:hypothetical protein
MTQAELFGKEEREREVSSDTFEDIPVMRTCKIFSSEYLTCFLPMELSRK